MSAEPEPGAESAVDPLLLFIESAKATRRAALVDAYAGALVDAGGFPVDAARVAALALTELPEEREWPQN